MSILAVLAGTGGGRLRSYPVPPYPIPTSAPYNVDHWLTFDDPYGHDGSVVHPDVLDFGEAGWRGRRYWMAATPYWMEDAGLENPCLWASDDVMHWEPAGSNPIYPAPPPPNWNSDTDIIHDPATDELVLIFRRGDFKTVAARSSDGVTWPTTPTLLDFPGFTGELVSPSLVLAGSTWHAWLIRHPEGTMHHWTAPQVEGPWTLVGECTGWGGGWHMNVVHDGTKFLMLTHRGARNGDAYCQTSIDGTAWATGTLPVLVRGRAGKWDSNILYRSAIVLHDTDPVMRVWYCGTGPGSWSWRLAYTEIPLTEWPTPPA